MKNPFKARRNRQRFVRITPEIINRMSADPTGTGEEVTDEEWEKISAQGPPACAVERAKELGKCGGRYAFYEMPKRTPDGFDVMIRVCDKHAELFVPMGFVRLED